jgi:hypothetical protein
MTWIDDCLAKRKVLEDREGTIRTFGERSYDELWDVISKFVVEAKNKGMMPVHTNGSPRRRIIRFNCVPSPRELRLDLDEGCSGISISGSSISRIKIGAGTDNVTFLERDGEKISAQDAARLILQPFLFPDLSSDRVSSDKD